MSYTENPMTFFAATGSAVAAGAAGAQAVRTNAIMSKAANIFEILEFMFLSL
jgi:hypothetical protein